ncbi:MAG: N-acetylmuramoyl-L-alanine amidase [Candidatus Krumholzibacteriota bacterium]|nr:N-acetylmuramoyl-L-alanine amidase [Candidatus Krumholzibacteriota bacterium]
MTERSILLVVIALLVAAAPAVAQEPDHLDVERTLGVIYADGREAEDIDLYRAEEGSEELYLTAYDLARVFKATKFWNPGLRKLSLRIGIHRYLFTIDTRVVTVDDEPALVRTPVRYFNGAVMVPLEFVSEILAPRLAEQLELDEEHGVLTIGSPDYNVTRLEFVEGEEGTRAELTLTEELLYHVDSETPGLLRLKIYGGKLNPLKFTVPRGAGLFNRVRAEQTEHDAYLFFDVQKTAERFRVEFESSGDDGRGPRKLVISLEEGDLPEIPDVEYAGKRMTEILDDDARARRTGSIRVVAIDPGHGGIDNGKVSQGGVREKDVNLEIAMLLRGRLVAELGVEVVLTRQEDVLVPFDRRVEIANRAKADVFISLHCNGWFHPDAGGFETLFLSPARTDDEERIASEENASIRFENPELDPDELAELDFILWDMVQNEFITESSEFAELVQREMSKTIEIRNRGVKQAGLRVLKGLHMPGILVESAFLSNPEEEELLLDADFRNRIVDGIIEALRRYQGRFGE